MRIHSIRVCTPAFKGHSVFLVHLSITRALTLTVETLESTKSSQARGEVTHATSCQAASQGLGFRV